jgi:hypothetical protein
MEGAVAVTVAVDPGVTLPAGAGNWLHPARMSSRLAKHRLAKHRLARTGLARIKLANVRLAEVFRGDCM